MLRQLPGIANSVPKAAGHIFVLRIFFLSFQLCFLTTFIDQFFTGTANCLWLLVGFNNPNSAHNRDNYRADYPRPGKPADKRSSHYKSCRGRERWKIVSLPGQHGGSEKRQRRPGGVTNKNTSSQATLGDSAAYTAGTESAPPQARAGASGSCI